MPTSGFCQRRRGCKSKNAGRNLRGAAFDASSKERVSAPDHCRDHFDCWNSAAVARRNGNTTHCVAGVPRARPPARCGGWTRMRRIDPGWKGVCPPAHRNYAYCCASFPAVVVPVLGERWSGCHSSVPAQPAAVMNNNWLMAAGVALGFGLERRDCFVPAAVRLVGFETPANCCSVVGNDFVSETRVAAGDCFGIRRWPDCP